MNMPDWDDLRYFLAVAKSGSLSGAAKSLAVEHSTVSRRIDALEGKLGVRLFDRFAKGWSITNAGTDLLPAAYRVEEEMYAIVRQAAGATEAHGTVRISAPPALCMHVIAPALANYRHHYPELQLVLIADSREADLAKREADIAIRYRRPTSPSMAVRALSDVGYGAYAAPAYLQDRPEEAWEFLGYSAELQGLPQQIWLEQTAAGRHFAFRSNDLGTLLQLAIAGAGIAVLPHLLVAGRRDLAEVPGLTCPVTRQLWLVMHDDVRKAPRVRAAADILISAFGAT